MLRCLLMKYQSKHHRLICHCCWKAGDCIPGNGWLQSLVETSPQGGARQDLSVEAWPIGLIASVLGTPGFVWNVR